MKILIIEDDKKLAEMLKTAFSKEGFTVDYLTDGKLGERRAELHHKDYDLLILDLMLPGQNGAEICKHLRERGISLPILVLTAKNEVSDKISLLNLGADDYMVKPFSFQELLARVQALVRRPSKVLPKELEASGLTLNPLTQKVSQGKKTINLTLKEFRILEYLMRHAGQVVNREELLNNLWDFNFDSFSNIVDVHIKNLRKKISGRKPEELLETIRGIGYRLKN